MVSVPYCAVSLPQASSVFGVSAPLRSLASTLPLMLAAASSAIAPVSFTACGASSLMTTVATISVLDTSVPSVTVTLNTSASLPSPSMTGAYSS